MIVLSAHLQLLVEQIDELSSNPTIFRHTLKKKANSFLEEAEKVLKLYLTDERGSQEQALELVNMLEEAYKQAYVHTKNQIKFKSEIDESNKDKCDS